MARRRALLRPAARIAERLPGNGRLPRLYWRFRHVLEGSAWIEGYFASSREEHRVRLAEIVAGTPGSSSCLEVGANAGANLIAIHRLRPDWRLVGADINPRVVKIGKKLLGRADLDIDLRLGDCCRLPWLADREVDVVLSDAVLMYVSPSNIRSTLSELVRVAARRILLNEFVTEGESRWLGRDWAHDLADMLAAFGLEPHVLPSPRVTSGGRWATLGRLVVADRASHG